jgi:hypothetical protein
MPRAPRQVTREAEVRPSKALRKRKKVAEEAV